MAASGEGGAGPPLTIRLFGPFEVLLNGEPLPRLHSRKRHWLLALLTLRHGSEVERAWLGGMLWPESSGSQLLRNSLTDLRRALGLEADRLRSPTSHTLCLDLAGAQVDLLDFDGYVARGDPASLEQAIALYRGPLLEGCAEEWVFLERESREQTYLGALETLATHALAAGNPEAAERRLRRAVAVDPLRESAQRALMQALAAGGNYAAAIQGYRELRLRLHRELNTTPDPETQTLFQQLRAEAREKAVLGARCSVLGGTGTGTPARGPSLPRPPAEHRAPSTEHLPKGTVTFLFTDIEGSTRLWEAHPEAMRPALVRHEALLREAIETHGGHVFKTVGDALCAAFPTAADALAAALAGQRGLQREAWAETGPLRVRMALHTGAAEEQNGDYFGPALNRVARLLKAGHGGQILLSSATQELVRDHLPQDTSLEDLGEHRLQDLARPERVFQLLTPDLPAHFPPLNTLEARRTNLSLPRTPLLGREREVAAVRDLLQREEVALVTLTGPGGSGKTRLGLEVAAGLLEEFASGVSFVDLAPLRDPDLVASTICQTLEVRETQNRSLQESLKDDLREKQLLLLLDNFEQVLSAAPLVAELLAEAPRLKVLVTSREVLHLHGEQEFPVPPLEVPDPRHLPPLPVLSQYAAVQLFLQRAVNARPEFALTPENARAVAEICHRLDGLPLAIELASARIKLFPPQGLLSRMERRLQLLTGGGRDAPARQQTLRNAIAWSYDLLEEGEKRLFRRLSIFVGGFTLGAAEAVCNAEGDLEFDVLDGVASLVDKSLLRQGEGAEGEPRFAMLETIREFGLECLARSGEAESLGRQHLNFFLELAERARPELLGPECERWLDDLEEEHDNLRAALEWSHSEEESGEAELRLAAALAHFWHLRAYWEEGRRWVEGALARSGHSRETDRVLAKARAWALWGAGLLANQLGDRAVARSRLEESLRLCRELGDKHQLAWSLCVMEERSSEEESAALFRELGDRWGLVWPLIFLGNRALQRGEYAEARALYEESLTIARELGEKGALARPLSMLGGLAWREGDYAAARSLLEESVALRREIRDPYRAWFIIDLGNVACEQGDYGQAAALFEESLVVSRELGQKSAIARSLVGLGAVARYQGDYAAARSLGEQALEILKESGHNESIARSLTLLGVVAHAQGHLAKARSCHEESLALWRELEESGTLAASLEGLAGVEAAEGHPERAARLFGAAEGLREGMGPPLPPADRAGHDRSRAAARAALGEEAFAASWAEGRALSLEAAVSLALEEPNDA